MGDYTHHTGLVCVSSVFIIYVPFPLVLDLFMYITKNKHSPHTNVCLCVVLTTTDQLC